MSCFSCKDYMYAFHIPVSVIVKLFHINFFCGLFYCPPYKVKDESVINT